jgi:hypothetical protein
MAFLTMVLPDSCSPSCRSVAQGVRRGDPPGYRNKPDHPPISARRSEAMLKTSNVNLETIPAPRCTVVGRLSEDSMRVNRDTPERKRIVEYWTRRVCDQPVREDDESAPPVLARPGLFVQSMQRKQSPKAVDAVDTTPVSRFGTD